MRFATITISSHHLFSGFPVSDWDYYNDGLRIQTNDLLNDGSLNDDRQRSYSTISLSYYLSNPLKIYSSLESSFIEFRSAASIR